MKEATLFVTCLADTFFPEVPRATLRVLDRLGFRLEIPARQTCCGQPMLNAGHRQAARAVARHFIEVFSPCPGPIIAPSSSCAAMVRHHFPLLFEEDPILLEQARMLAARTFELSEFLVKEQGLDLAGLGASFQGSVTFHRSCHFRSLGLEREPIDLIRQIPGIEYRPLDKVEECCGFGGTFSLHFSHVSEAMVKAKLRNIEATRADWLIYADSGCAMNILGHAHRRGKPIQAMHLAQLIDQALGGGP
jgi:L-lactate dehydrogenase complex protein LldE